MQSTIKLQQVEDKESHVILHYEITASGEKLRRNLIVDPFDIQASTESDIVGIIIANEDDEEINFELNRIKESKIGRYFPTADGTMVPVGGTEVKRWKVGVNFVANEIVSFKGKLYSVTQAHTSQSDWAPDVALSLFAKAQILGADTAPQWVQPDGAGGPNLPYPQGAQVTHNGSTWTSDVNDNVWEPGVSQWTEVGSEVI